jgi:hypothetical protein
LYVRAVAEAQDVRRPRRPTMGRAERMIAALVDVLRASKKKCEN